MLVSEFIVVVGLFKYSLVPTTADHCGQHISGIHDKLSSQDIGVGNKGARRVVPPVLVSLCIGI